jgi:hypothetical protein
MPSPEKVSISLKKGDMLAFAAVTIDIDRVRPRI